MDLVDIESGDFPSPKRHRPSAYHREHERHHRRKHHHRERSKHHYREHKRKRDPSNDKLGADLRKYDTVEANEPNPDLESYRLSAEESKKLSDVLVADLAEESNEPCAPSPEIGEETAQQPEANEPLGVDTTLPPYFPAIEGCRSLNEFHCLNRIAEGTYGVVYRFKDKRSGEIVALKKLKMEKEKEGFPRTSLREINTLLKAQHPNIVTVREIVMGSNMDKIFIVMDYVEHDLKTLIESMKSKEQRFMPAEVKCLLRQLLLAVAHLHDNWILHRDLKTSNLLLSHKGILKVGDFGLAREYGSPLKCYTSLVVTLWYRAPELLLGCEKYSTHIDVWSVGCIFAEFILMTAMFPGKSEVEQINRIFKSLGTPNEKIWPGYNKLPAVQKIKLPNHQMSNLRKKFQMLSDMGLNLLLQFLTYDPEQRITAEKAIKHPYFNEYPTAIDPASFPQWPAKSEGHRRIASPKAPPGGAEFDQEYGGDSGGFRIGFDSTNSRTGAGFNLKF